MLGNFLRKVKNSFLKKSISKHEKTYNHLKYCFYPDRRSNKLIIVFSGFPGGGGTAKYNYINTLSAVKANKLFLLDDVWNPVNVGSYYLGSGGNWYYINDICSLVSDIVSEIKINRVITAGSSKGGTSALFYGIKLEADVCIIGAPQYYIGNYLATEKHLPILEAIMGDTSQLSVSKLNDVVKSEIDNEHGKKPAIYLHYSPREHTYEDHIQGMMRDLRENGFVIFEDNDYSYTHHSEVKDYFPSYLLKTVKAI